MNNGYENPDLLFTFQIIRFLQTLRYYIVMMIAEEEISEEMQEFVKPLIDFCNKMISTLMKESTKLKFWEVIWGNHGYREEYFKGNDSDELKGG